MVGFGRQQVQCRLSSFIFLEFWGARKMPNILQKEKLRTKIGPLQKFYGRANKSFTEDLTGWERMHQLNPSSYLQLIM